MIHTYDCAKVLFSFGGSPITGFAADTFIEVERDEDAYTKSGGTRGETVRSVNPNKGGSITITLMDDSISNDILSAIAIADELSRTGVVPCLGKEIGGTMLFAAGNSWIKKLPKIERGKELGTTKWVFDCASLEIFAGGLI